MTQAFFAATLILMSNPHSDKERPEAVIKVVESLQAPLRDFRCEYEGKSYRKEEEARKSKGLDATGLFDTFSGVYVWRAGGDVFNETYHRYEPQGSMTRQTLIVRPSERRAEEHFRADDKPLGNVSIDLPENIKASYRSCYGKIYFLDDLKAFVADPQFRIIVEDDHLDDRPVKVLTVMFRGIDFPINRYWLDLNRSGHAIRFESYGPKGVLAGRTDIRLTAFKIGGEEVWMPTWGHTEAYATLKDGKPAFESKPTIVEELYIMKDTLVFNQSPPDSVFRADYKAGTPVSDKVRQQQYEFGSRLPKLRPTRLQAELELREQLAEADRQGKELAASAPSQARDWTGFIAAGFGAIALGASIFLWIQARRR